jgi:hypothetical protein
MICHYRAATATLLLCAAGASAEAQNAPKPYPAIYGGAAVGNPENGPKINLSLQAVDAYDDNLQADVAGGPATSAVQASGYFTVLNPAMTLDAKAGGVHIGASANSDIRYYGDLQKVLVTGQAAAIGFNGELNTHTNVFINQSVSYAPAYLHGLFASVPSTAPGTPIESASDYDVDAIHSFVYGTTAKLTRVVTPRIDLSAEAGYHRTDFTGASSPGYFDLRGYDAGGTMRYSMSRNLKLRLGYTYRLTQYTSTYHPEENDIDIGFEYSRQLSSLRRTTFAFTLGPSIASGVSPGTGSTPSDKQYRLGGDFSVNHQLTRTWTVRGDVHRGLGYLENVARPVLTNAARADVQGFLNRRTDVSASAGYTTGELALTGTPPPFSTYTGTVRLRFAFARHLAAFGEYLYYYYEFNRDFPLPPGVASTLTRNGVRAGVMLWVPVGRK